MKLIICLRDPVYLFPCILFCRRIITSSAKPEKRIVAHKASIIEIVKITIEGAHEPLSSSYSSGQSIYFGFNDFRQIPV